MYLSTLRSVPPPYFTCNPGYPRRIQSGLGELGKVTTRARLCGRFRVFSGLQNAAGIFCERQSAGQSHVEGGWGRLSGRQLPSCARKECKVKLRHRTCGGPRAAQVARARLRDRTQATWRPARITDPGRTLYTTVTHLHFKDIHEVQFRRAHC